MIHRWIQDTRWDQSRSIWTWNQILRDNREIPQHISGESTRYQPIRKRKFGQNITIMLDGQAAIQALSSPVIRSRTVLEFRQRLNLLEEAKPSFHWEPAHISVEGNQKLMSLQGRGHRPPLVVPKPFCGLGDAFFKEKIKSNCNQERQTQEGDRRTKTDQRTIGGWNYEKVQSKHLHKSEIPD